MGQRKKLGWLEFGRGIAALIVVISHAALAGAPEELFMWSGVYAVAFFFILSGFIILHIHADDIDRPEAAPVYLWRRAVRIFPTYWFIAFVGIALHLASHNHDRMPALNLQSVVHELLLLPGGEPFVQVAWTLRHELLFYGLFLTLILNARIGVSLFSMWLISIIYAWITEGWLYWVSDASRPALQVVLSPINLFFFVGLALAWASRMRPLQSNDCIKPPQISCWLGKISYPLYLSHFTVYFIAGGVFKRIGVTIPWPIYLALVVLASVLIAWLVANLFEKPLLSRLQQLGPRRRPAHSFKDYSSPRSNSTAA